MSFLNLYKITLSGMTYSLIGSPIYGTAYVVASSTDEAYQQVKKYLDDQDIGTYTDRKLISIEVIASESFNLSKYKLYFPKNCDEKIINN